MRFLLKLFSFIIFLFLAIGAMFVGGVTGVASSFYLMVKEGLIEDNLTMGIAALAISLFLVLVLRGQNKKVLKQRKRREQEMEQSDWTEEEYQ